MDEKLYEVKEKWQEDKEGEKYERGENCWQVVNMKE